MSHKQDVTFSLTSVRTEGALLPPDILAKVVTNSLPGMSAQEYNLAKGEKLNEAINRSWNRMYALWGKFQQQRALLHETETGTSLTREGLLLPLFDELGYGRLLLAKTEERTLANKDFAISHTWHNSPIHLLGCGVDIERRTKGVRGAVHASPHSLVQDFLNNSEKHLWGFCSNGLRLRILRDNVSLSRQAYIEFDLEAIFEGEVFSDFVLLWLLCHQSRVESEKSSDCWLEQWTRAAQEQGVRALDSLRDSVQKAIEILGQGFLEAHNANLKQSLQNYDLSPQDFFRQLLRLIYRLLFLFAAEDRQVLHAEHIPIAVKNRYLAWYSTTRLRKISGAIVGTKHYDLYESLKNVMNYLGREQGCEELGLTPLGSFLWSSEALPDIHTATLSNYHLLAAVRTLAFTENQGIRRPVDYKNVGARELGSIYESLLELHPQLDTSSGYFQLLTTAGNERKTTGSYYTPTVLIENLLDTALEPIIHQALSKENPEQALLNITICDPACGSGHFLIAAAHRLAKRLASLRTGDTEPSPNFIQTALRDVIGSCIYGVDSNPMAVELCKVSLWMEALELGKPLSFLDSHICCGNSLIGTIPGLIGDAGLPDTAFTALLGDDKSACSTLKRNNKAANNETNLPLLAEQRRQQSDIIYKLAEGIETLSSDNMHNINAKAQAFHTLQENNEYIKSKFLADLWCAAFVIRKYFYSNSDNVLSKTPYGITQRHLADYAQGKHISEELQKDVQELASQYQFFHWHLAFPKVFARGGFDCILGNPPWEKIKIQEKEWFAQRVPKIATASNAAARLKLINDLKSNDIELYNLFKKDVRKAEGQSHFMRNSGRFPLCGRGDINVYTVFAETARTLINPYGRMGCVIPSGIASDDTTKFFFQDIVEKKSLVSLFDFENKGIFPGVHNSYKFCLFTCGQGSFPTVEKADFVFFAHAVEELQNNERRFFLSPKDFALLNPNTRTCPIFRTRLDAELTKAIYRRVPVLIREAQNGQKEENPWGIKLSTMFHMSNDSHLFYTKEQLETQGFILDGNTFIKNEEFTNDEGNEDVKLQEFLPLYEAKMIHHYNHRWATYEGEKNRDVSFSELQDTTFTVLPRYWVQREHVLAKVKALNWEYAWFMGWRDIARSTDERTVVGGLLPLSAVGNKLPLWISQHVSLSSLLALLSSFMCDFTARNKIAGTTLNFFILKQLAVLPPTIFDTPCPWNTTAILAEWIRPRILELTYTADDMRNFAKDCGYDGSPFVWDEERRFILLAELDAAFFYLYFMPNIDGTWQKTHNESVDDFKALCQCFASPRHAVSYVMETFPIVKKRDEANFGTYRTKETILEIYDDLQQAVATGIAYTSPLDIVQLKQSALPEINSKPSNYKPSPVEFPHWEREKRVRDGIALLMRDAPDKSFDEYFEAMLLATKPELCKAFLPEYAQVDFDKALNATNYTSWEFAKEDKIRYEKCKANIRQHVSSILSGQFFEKERFQNISFKGLAIYLFVALDATKVEKPYITKQIKQSFEDERIAANMDSEQNVA